MPKAAKLKGVKFL